MKRTKAPKRIRTKKAGIEKHGKTNTLEGWAEIILGDKLKKKRKRTKQKNKPYFTLGAVGWSEGSWKAGETIELELPTKHPYHPNKWKKKRKRIVRKRSNEKNLICSNANHCWYKGPCPHRKPHRHSKFCEEGFCSLMRLACCCKEKESC